MTDGVLVVLGGSIPVSMEADIIKVRLFFVFCLIVVLVAAIIFPNGRQRIAAVNPPTFSPIVVLVFLIGSGRGDIVRGSRRPERATGIPT